jgi:hypothetical protein
MAKMSSVYEGHPKFLLRTLAWYFARIWVEVTPTRMVWWPAGRLDVQPREWTAPEGTAAAPSDPAPPGRQPGAWSEQPPGWRQAAEQAVRDLLFRDLTVVGADGFPECWPAGEVTVVPDGFRIRPASGVGTIAGGRACLTLHTHDPVFTTQQNRVFVGRVSGADDGTLIFEVERMLGDWSLGKSRLSTTLDFLLGSGRRLRSRLRREADRRGQPIPKVRFPGEY